MKNIFAILLLVVLSGCNTLNYVGIQTYNPAEVTFPSSVEKVLVVNNAVPQPDDKGHEYSYFGREAKVGKIRTDSALVYFCNALGRSIFDLSYFSDVLLYPDALRQDNNFLDDKKLSPSQVSSLCEDNGADAVISLDRLVFRLNRDVSLYNGYIEGGEKVYVDGVVRVYVPGRSSALAAVVVSDSVEWREIVFDEGAIDYVIPSPQFAVYLAGEVVGSNLSPCFVPHWMDETRWYFSQAGTLWKEASAFAADEKWDNAVDRWKKIYQTTKSDKAKAKAAANMALAAELDGDLKKSYELIKEAYDLYPDNDDECKVHLYLYKESILQRLLVNEKLNLQIGGTKSDD